MSSDSNNVFTPVKKNSKFISLKVHRIKKMLKPVMKLLNRKSHRFESQLDQHSYQQSPTVDENVSEIDQNAANEALEARLRDDLIEKSEADGGVIGVWMQGRMTLVPVARGHQQIPIPVHFACTSSGEFAWTPLPDSDICLLGNVQTTGQTAEEQVPSSKQIDS